MAELPPSPGPVDWRIGARLRQRRELLGLSLDVLARHLGCPEGRIQDYEAGRVRIGAATLMLLTQMLGVDIGYFLRGLAEDTPPPPAGPDRPARDKLIS